MAKTTPRSTLPVPALAVGLLVLIVAGPGALSGQEEKKKGSFTRGGHRRGQLCRHGRQYGHPALSLGTSFSRKWTNDTLLFKGYILKATRRRRRGPPREQRMISSLSKTE